MCVCVCVFIHISMCVVCVYLSVRMYVLTYYSDGLMFEVSMYTCVCVCVCVSVFVCLDICVGHTVVIFVLTIVKTSILGRRGVAPSLYALESCHLARVQILASSPL